MRPFTVFVKVEGDRYVNLDSVDVVEANEREKGSILTVSSGSSCMLIFSELTPEEFVKKANKAQHPRITVEGDRMVLHHE